MTLYAAVNDRRVIWADIRIPWCGVWSADLRLDVAGPVLGGRVTVRIGGLSLSGTVDPEHVGSFADARELRVLGGAGAWGTEIGPWASHNDAGVKVSEVLGAAAGAVGETLRLEAALDVRLSADYVRELGPASAVFHGASPGAVWWVDAAGVTQVAAARATSELAPGADVQVLNVDALEGNAELAGDPAAVPLGVVLRDKRLTAPIVVRELAITLDTNEQGRPALRMYAYSRSDAAGGQLLDPLVDLMRSIRDERLPGVYRYRVVSMSGDRVKLQAVTKGRWPNVVPCSLGAGVAGGWAELAPGAVVVVAFQDEDRTAPMIISCTPKGRPGHLPAVAALDATGTVKLGGGGPKVVRVGDFGVAGSLLGAGSLGYTGPNGGAGTITASIQHAALGPNPVPVVFAGSASLTTEATEGASKTEAG